MAETTTVDKATLTFLPSTYDLAEYLGGPGSFSGIQIGKVENALKYSDPESIIDRAVLGAQMFAAEASLPENDANTLAGKVGEFLKHLRTDELVRVAQFCQGDWGAFAKYILENKIKDSRQWLRHWSDIIDDQEEQLNEA